MPRRTCRQRRSSGLLLGSTWSSNSDWVPLRCRRLESLRTAHSLYTLRWGAWVSGFASTAHKREIEHPYDGAQSKHRSHDSVILLGIGSASPKGRRLSGKLTIYAPFLPLIGSVRLAKHCYNHHNQKRPEHQYMHTYARLVPRAAKAGDFKLVHFGTYMR